MGKVIYIEFSGVEHQVEVGLGQSIMQGAVENAVPGILAECGGSCACATCHVYVDPAWSERVGSPEALEDAMLEVVDERAPTSRLSCQIRMRDEFDGLIVRMPEKQS